VAKQVLQPTKTTGAWKLLINLVYIRLVLFWNYDTLLYIVFLILPLATTTITTITISVTMVIISVTMMIISVTMGTLPLLWEPLPIAW
jgi:hypothetical protein